MNLGFTPLIIIGAGRSGTNMLRNSICTIPDFATWNCDEINPIWRYGNTSHPDDYFTEEQATHEVSNYLRTKFIQQWKSLGKPNYLVEKTCANSLRVSFIAKIFPEAKFIYIVRNGVDVTVSASKRWKGEMEIPSLPYYWSKIRNTPINDLPHYGWRFISSRTAMIFGHKKHLSFWGPQYPSLKTLPENTPLLELCARQWAECVDASDRSFEELPATAWTRVRYEDFVVSPIHSMNLVLSFLQLETNESIVEQSVSNISSKSAEKMDKKYDCISENIKEILTPSLRKHGYLAL